MLLNFITLLLLGGMATASTSILPRHKIQFDYSQMIMNSLSSVQNNPNRYQECFTYYSPLMTQAGDRYEKQVNTCNENAENSRLNISQNEQVVSAKNDVSGIATSLCSNLQVCNDLTDPLGYFQCYSKQGSEGSQESSSIKYKSNDSLEYIQNLIKTIDSQENICVNDASAKYNSEWSLLSAQLQICFTTDETTPSAMV